MSKPHESNKAGVSRRRFLALSAGVCGTFALASYTRLHGVLAASGMVTIADFDGSGKLTGKTSVPRVVKPDAAWKQQLTPIQYQVTRRAGTERAYTGATWDLHEHGVFRCVCCGLALFRSETKFDSGTGWPSFWQPIAKENVVDSNDTSVGMDRTAVSCRQCDAHLGHVFDDGPRPTGLRYCMNSAAMQFVKTA